MVQRRVHAFVTSPAFGWLRRKGIRLVCLAPQAPEMHLWQLYMAYQDHHIWNSLLITTWSGVLKSTYYALNSFFLLSGFYPIVFFQLKVFNKIAHAYDLILSYAFFFTYYRFFSHWIFRFKVFNETYSSNFIVDYNDATSRGSRMKHVIKL